MKKFDLIKILKEKGIKENWDYLGALVVFQDKKENIGTFTHVKNPVFILKLIEEAKLQELMRKKQREIWVNEEFKPHIIPTKKKIPMVG